ncbi:M48 family metallopeptidase [Tolumonas osonensis]|uniref:Zn-dependent protease with chaperone function n=1 Tax=Tolumonas osonensis TaxID=675874 RepID=A0A841G9H6_9GAMM|nr:M48 family metallopeptidase [Tolumonas osonensis]MBB6054589.1 Zn-dependent protease with chaperone function [Tolumonas osonensis]
MDFYRYQDQAKKLSARLLFLFFSGLLSLSVALTFAGFMLWKLTDQTVHINTDSQFWHWYVTGNIVILAVLVLITLLKYTSLCKGGRVVAETLGARYVHVNTQDPGDRRLRNVVEEMALASGIPVPSVYVLDNEPGINAFAAGMSMNDAVVVVTQGAISYLSRDELQAVVAHEFSHILHGDIRLNQQLAALIGSLMFLGELGRWLTQGSGRHYRISNSSRGKSSSALPFFGLTLMLLGAAGTIWGRLMKAALNRQREFLADASAVQFTRYPAPLASALKKVGGHRYASLVFHPQAETFSHLFFSQGLTQNFCGWLASHPPLQDRIRRLDPQWDGKYYANLQPVMEEEPAPSLPESFIAGVQQQANGNQDLAAMLLAQNALTSTQWEMPKQPKPTPDELPLTTGAQPVLYDPTAISDWLPKLPEPLVTATRSPFDARLLIYRLVLATDLTTRLKQRHLLGQEESAVLALAQYIIPNGLQLALVELAIPALKELTRDQYQQFHDQLQVLIQADQKTSFHEWLLYRMLTHQLQPHFGQTKRPGIQYRDISEVVTALETWFSYLAQINSLNKPAKEAFAIYTAPLAMHSPLTLQAKPSLDSLGLALDQLQLSSPAIRFRLMQALINAIEQDGQITEQEAGIFQMLSYCLDCPLPPPQVQI